MKTVILSTLLLGSAIVAGSVEERLQGMAQEGALEAPLPDIAPRRRKDGWLPRLARTRVCQSGMIAGVVIDDTKRELERAFNPDLQFDVFTCDQLKASFLPYINSCELDPSSNPKVTVYAGRNMGGSALGGVSKTYGAYIDSDGNTGCFIESCGSGGLQVGVSAGFTVGVVYGDENALGGWSAGLEGSISFGPGADLGGGMTLPDGIAYVESGAGIGASVVVGGVVCKTKIYQHEVEQQRLNLINQWAEINGETKDDWKLGRCSMSQGQRISQSKGRNDLNHMVDCLNKCRSTPSARSCEYVFKSSADKIRGCYYHTTNAETNLDDSPSAMCYSQLRTVCTDLSGWSDKDGDSCYEYKELAYCENGQQGNGWNDAWGPISHFATGGDAFVAGVSAYDACCECGRVATH